MPKDFILADGRQYILDRNHIPCSLLNLKRILCREVLQFSIHPFIEIPPAPAITYVAIGTSLWLLDVARQHPDAKLHGLDANRTQAPHPAWLLSIEMVIENGGRYL